MSVIRGLHAHISLYIASCTHSEFKFETVIVSSTYTRIALLQCQTFDARLIKNPIRLILLLYGDPQGSGLGPQLNYYDWSDKHRVRRQNSEVMEISGKLHASD